MCGNLLLCIVYITIIITKYYYNYKYNYHLNCNLSQSPLINYPRFYLRLSICFFFAQIKQILTIFGYTYIDGTFHWNAE